MWRLDGRSDVEQLLCTGWNGEAPTKQLQSSKMIGWQSRLRTVCIGSIKVRTNRAGSVKIVKQLIKWPVTALYKLQRWVGTLVVSNEEIKCNCACL